MEDCRELDEELDADMEDDREFHADMEDCHPKDRRPIPNPPEGGKAMQDETGTTVQVPYNSIAELMAGLNAWGKQNGIGFVKDQASNYRGNMPTTWRVHCDRWGYPKSKSSPAKRKRRTRKCGCTWQGVAHLLKADGGWTFKLGVGSQQEHNHGQSFHASAHVIHRKLTEKQQGMVMEQGKQPTQRAREIRAYLLAEDPNYVGVSKDIYNMQQRFRRAELGGLTPIQALIRVFDEEGIKYIPKWAADDVNRVEGLFWTFQECEKMWKIFPEVISCDNTYRTNRFGWPLFVITGITSINSIFNVAFGLIADETENSFTWLFQQLELLRIEVGAEEPTLVLTDFDKWMKRAMATVFPNTQQQICIFHINANVLHKAKKFWKYDGNVQEEDVSDDIERLDTMPFNSEEHQVLHDLNGISTTETDIPHDHQGLLKMWKLVVFAKTLVLHNEAWLNLCKEFADQERILQYLQNTYMPWRDQWAQFAIKQYKNWGHRTTSPTESANKTVKSYLVSSQSDFYGLVKALRVMVQQRVLDFDTRVADDDVKIGETYRNRQWLGDLTMEVSFHCLSLINREHLAADAALPTRREPRCLGPCDETCTVSTQFGIPCRHVQFEMLLTQEPLTRWHVHPHWHLERRLSYRDAYVKIKDPKIAERRRGRPKNTPQGLPQELQVQQSHESQQSMRGRGSRGRSSRGRGPRGRRGRGPRFNPNIRRYPSHFEEELAEMRSQEQSQQSIQSQLTNR